MASSLKLRLAGRRNILTMRVLKHWNRLRREIVKSPSLYIFKSRTDIWLGWSSQGWSLSRGSDLVKSLSALLSYDPIILYIIKSRYHNRNIFYSLKEIDVRFIWIHFFFKKKRSYNSPNSSLFRPAQTSNLLVTKYCFLLFVHYATKLQPTNYLWIKVWMYCVVDPMVLLPAGYLKHF